MSFKDRKAVEIIGALCALLLAAIIGMGVMPTLRRFLPPEPVPPLIEFLHASVAPNDGLRPGDEVVLTYVGRWNFACSYVVRPFFVNLGKDARDGEVTRAAVPSAHAKTAPGTHDRVRAAIILPENIYRGTWGYYGAADPDPDCPTQEIVESPMVTFTVVEEVACDRVRVSASGRYHEPGSPWYHKVTRPIACFDDAAAAEAAPAGYTRAGQ